MLPNAPGGRSLTTHTLTLASLVLPVGFSIPSKACNAASNFILTDTLLKVHFFFYAAQRELTVSA